MGKNGNEEPRRSPRMLWHIVSDLNTLFTPPTPSPKCTPWFPERREEGQDDKDPSACVLGVEKVLSAFSPLTPQPQTHLSLFTHGFLAPGEKTEFSNRPNIYLSLHATKFCHWKVWGETFIGLPSFRSIGVRPPGLKSSAATRQVCDPEYLISLYLSVLIWKMW